MKSNDENPDEGPGMGTALEPGLESGAPEAADDGKYHSDEKLFRIASWANTLAWVVLVLYLLIFVGRIVSIFQAGNVTPLTSVDGIVFWLSSLSTPVIGCLYFMLLQAVSEGVYMLMDLEDNGLALLSGKNRKE
jgi:hypothetical protein